MVGVPLLRKICRICCCEWEEVGIAWARVERRDSEANVNSHRLSSKVRQFPRSQLLAPVAHYNELEIGRYLVYTGAGVAS